MKRNEVSTTERLLASIETKPTRSMRSSWLLRLARQQSEIAARALASGRCSLRPVIAARSAAARAQDAGAPGADIVKVQRELDRLEATFASACVAPRPRGR
jgi:hypothetical protein